MNERYSRQILFREIGKNGQKKLLSSRVLLAEMIILKRNACYVISPFIFKVSEYNKFQIFNRFTNRNLV